MSGQPETSNTDELVLACNDLLYRPIIDKRWFDKATGKLLDFAFRRKRSDANGLSVNVVKSYSVRQCVESDNYTECFEVGTLHVGRIRDLGLDVVADSPHHANIIGLTAYDEGGPLHDARREFLAKELLKQFRSVWVADKVRAKRGT
jgi:hypothetical protein